MQEIYSKSFQADSDFLTVQYQKKYADNIAQPQYLTTNKGTILVLSPSALLELNGKLQLGTGCGEDYYRSTILRMDARSKLIICEGGTSICYGGDITLFHDSTLTLGNNTYLDANCFIRCSVSISIGNDCFVSAGVSILDSDKHTTLYKSQEDQKQEKGIIIGNHVWIGENVRVLKNVSIGDGAIITSGAVVTQDVPPHTLVSGNPANVIQTEIDWKV